MAQGGALFSFLQCCTVRKLTPQMDATAFVASSLQFLTQFCEAQKNHRSKSLSEFCTVSPQRRMYKSLKNRGKCCDEGHKKWGSREVISYNKYYVNQKVSVTSHLIEKASQLAQICLRTLARLRTMMILKVQPISPHTISRRRLLLNIRRRTANFIEPAGVIQSADALTHL